MPSRSRSRKSSRSSAKSPFKSASILEQGGQPALRHEDTAAPSPSNTASQVEILVSSTAQPESPHLFHPSDPRSPLAGNATSATEAGASIKLTQSDASSLKSDSTHEDQTSFQDEDTVPAALALDEIEDVPRTPQPGSAQLPRPSLPGSWPDGNDPSATATAEPAVDDPVEPQSQAESAGVRTNPTAHGQRERLPHKRFGLNTEQRRGQPAPGGLPMDYKQKYPEDPIYKETEENARVFHVYNDESQLFDNDMIGEAGDSLDILLVFAGLFASVLTTFVAQTSQSLSPDKTEISNSLLREMISLQRAQENGTSFSSVPAANTSFIASRSDIWVNSLWFISLALSLSTALLAVIAKQWLRQYSSFISGTPRDRALIRQFRYDGLEKWGVRLIIGLLPTILHISLFLFMAGLIVLLLPLNNALACTVAGIAGFLCATYVIANALPVIFIQCPYRTPLSEIINSICGGVRMAFEVMWSLGVVLLVHVNVIYDSDSYAWIPRWVSVYRQDGVIHWPASLKDIERARANEEDKWGRPLGIGGALIWLAQTTSDISVKAIIAEAVGSVSHPSSTLYGAVEQQWGIISGQRIQLLGAEDERIVERLMRGAALGQYDIAFDVLPTDVQDYSTLLAFAVTNDCTARFHGRGGGGVNLMKAHLVFRLVLEQPEMWDEFEAPTWLWWVICKQAELKEWEILEQQEVTDFCVSGSIDVGLQFLGRLLIPPTLRHAVRERMIETYAKYGRVERPVSLSIASEFYVRARHEFEQNPPAPFATVSLVTFFADNFARCIDFWAG